MKNCCITIFACLLAMSCSKVMPEEAVVVPAGEKVTFTIPETKVAIGADEGDGTRKYVFENGDIIYAVTTEGSVAAMEFKGENTFAGEFSKPVGPDEKINLYYGCYSAESNAPVYVQNGKPWLVSKDNDYSRDDNNTIALSATLDAPKGVVGLPIISKFGECAVEFHAKNENEKISSFDGSSFSGGNAITGITLKPAAGEEYAAIVNVPAGMEGGFWIKAIKDGQNMYKSTSATVSNKSFMMNEFTPASVSIDVQISGFPTSYSYYIANEKIDGISAKDVNKANSVSNDWMGPGKAVCTITKSGIPSALLKVKSVSLFVNGTEFSGIEYTVGGNNTITINETAHSAWEQKNLTVKVVYATPDGTEFESNTSNTLTRYITGLPYSKDFSSDNDATNWLGTTKYQDSKSKGYQLAYKYLAEEKKYDIFSPEFMIPSKQTIAIYYSVNISGWQTGAKVSNGKSTICVGIASDTKTAKDLSYTLSENSERFSDWGKITSYTFNNSSDMGDKNRLSIYVESLDWGTSTQHYAILNSCNIKYR